MVKQFDARYRVTIYSNKETTIVEYPITCKFNVTRGIFSESNKANIQLYNLAPTTRNQIFQDMYTLDPEKQKYVHLEAGWNGSMSLIFRGRIMQAYSYKSGGQTDVITEIQAVALDIFDFQSSHTFAAGTTYKDAYKTMAADLPNVIIGDTGTLEGAFQTPTTFEGTTIDCLNTLTGGHTFVDNGVLNTTMDNEVRDVPVPVISNNTTLLETPMRRDANLEIKTIFLPDIVTAQLVEVDSSISPDFNGQFKLVGFTHDCLISPTQSGTRTTQMTLWIGPLLPDSNIALTGDSSANGFNKVKGEDITPVNSKPITQKFIRPCPGRITSGYGRRIAPKPGASVNHQGIDIGAPLGTPVKAVADGTVVFSAYDGNINGNKVKINHGRINGKTVYSTCVHLNARYVSAGQKVKQGSKIGSVGNTGNSTGPHLHISIYENNTPVNPTKYIKF